EDMGRESYRLTEGLLQREDVVFVPQDDGPVSDDELQSRDNHERTIAQFRFLWLQRGYLSKVFGCGLIVSLLFAFLIPSQYESTARLMPPESGGGALATLAGLGGRAGDMAGGLSGLAGDVLGLKESGD